MWSLSIACLLHPVVRANSLGFSAKCWASQLALYFCSYAKAGYWQINFDDFPNAMLSLFALVIVNKCVCR